MDDVSKRSQLRRELDSLKAILREDKRYLNAKQSFSFRPVGYLQLITNSVESSEQSPFIVHLLEVLSNPLDGTLSICLEFMDGGIHYCSSSVILLLL